MSPYQVLGVAPGATRAEVRWAWRRRALETHPDQGGDPVAFHAARQAFVALAAGPALLQGAAPIVVRHMGPAALALRWWCRRQGRSHRPRVT